MKDVWKRTASLLAAAVLVFVMVMPVNAASGWFIPDDPISETPEPTPSESVMEQDAEQPQLNLADPVIDVWYEGNLNFGSLGNPQDQINILGNVNDPDGSISSLTYKLNGGSSVKLALGTSNVRLVREGDFNAAIKLTSSDLKEGSNTIVFTAKDNGGADTTKSVNFTFTRGKNWPLPYNTNWGSASSIQSKAEVVDGLWELNGSRVRPIEVGYDRLIAIGSENWSNYEVTVPITFHSFSPKPDGTDPGGVGVIVYWHGHLGSSQPPTGWQNFGAYAYYSNRNGGNLALRIDAGSAANKSFPALDSGKTYIYKVRVGNSGSDVYYSFKVWEQGQSEPGWAWENVKGTNFKNGSVLLVAHRTDASFGNVSITKLGSQPTPVTPSATPVTPSATPVTPTPPTKTPTATQTSPPIELDFNTFLPMITK